MKRPPQEQLDELRHQWGANVYIAGFSIIATCPQSLDHPDEGGWFVARFFPGIDEDGARRVIAEARDGMGELGEQGCPVHGRSRLRWARRYQLTFQWDNEDDDAGPVVKRTMGGGWA